MTIGEPGNPELSRSLHGRPAQIDGAPDRDEYACLRSDDLAIADRQVGRRGGKLDRAEVLALNYALKDEIVRV
jgi:hypothetical protein